MADRTHEFLQIAQVLHNASAGGGQLKQSAPKSRTAFHDAAEEIAKGIHRTSGVLNKLTKLVRRQGLFDDPTEEINSLIYRIKQDLDELNTKCDSAQQFVDQKKRSLGNANQSAAHNVKVVSQLKTDLMHATKDFKTVLEVRSSKMKDQQVRKVELTGNGVLSPMRQFAATTNAQKGSASAASKADPEAGGVGGGVGGGGGGTSGKAQYYTPYGTDQQQQQQQLLLAPPATQQYYESRERAVGEVESTIGELGQLFKRLATMIQEQQEMVERIDDDVESARGNADAAHSLLLKTYESVSSNRGLYTKILAIVGLFGIMFTLFLL
jgi:syntaxin 5